jgi:PAS domain S-box-containing protein
MNRLLQAIQAFADIAAGPFRRREREAVGESQGLYRQLMEILPDAVSIHADSRIVDANASAAKLFGYSTAPELLGKDLLDFVPEEDRKGFADRNPSVGDGAARPLESRIVRPDGETRAVESIMALTQYQGKPATIVVQRDVTESRLQQDQLVQSKKMEAVGQ